MRVFLAIDFPESVKSRIFHKFEILSRKNLFRGKPVEKDNLHLTLKFFGNVSEKKLDKIKQQMKKIKFEKLNCEVGKIGFFDNENNIKVIWFEFLNEKLKFLNDVVEKEFGRDKKPFSSHITVARVKQVTNKQELLKELKGLNFKNLKFEINEMVLMKSILTSRGSKYKILERCPFI
jgi:2'-5' RNA ligase